MALVRQLFGVLEALLAWFKGLAAPMKALVIVGVVLASIVAGATTGEPGDTSQAAGDGGSTERREPLTLAEELGITIEEDVTPDLVGLNAVQVAAVIEEMNERPRYLNGWPRGVEPEDDGFEVAGLTYFVCEQSEEPGERYRSSMRLDFRTDCSNWKVVPDFVGLTEAAAEDLARERDISLAGARNDEQSFVCEQDVEPGTVLDGSSGSRYERVRVTGRRDCPAYFAELAERAAEEARREEEQRAREERQAILDDPNTEDGRKVFINQMSDALAAVESGARATRGEIQTGQFLSSFSEIFRRTGYSAFRSGFGSLREQGPDDVQAEWQRYYDQIQAAEQELDGAIDEWIDDLLSDAELQAYFAEMERQARPARAFIESLR
jgi:hypothetical protein